MYICICVCITIIHPASFTSCDETVMQAYNLIDCGPGICGTPTPTSGVTKKKLEGIPNDWFPPLKITMSGRFGATPNLAHPN